MRLALVSAALLGAGAVLAAPGSLDAQPRQDHEVVIWVDTDTGDLSYSQDPVLAFPRDRIIFSAPDVDEWVVTFRGDTPFNGREIRGRGDQVRRVPVLPSAATGSYKYDVSVTVNGQTFTEDPEIIIRDRMRRDEEQAGGVRPDAMRLLHPR